MKAKLLSLTMIAILPIGANAGYKYNQVNTPAKVADNGTVKIAPIGPYVTAEPTAADETHIATTAYVKGAYNDAIAAVNTVHSVATEKQDMLMARQTFKAIDSKVHTGLEFSSLWPSMSYTPEEEYDMFNVYDQRLPSMGAVISGINYVNNRFDNQRVKIYTTWDDDSSSATVEVPLVTATAQ